MPALRLIPTTGCWPLALLLLAGCGGGTPPSAPPAVASPAAVAPPAAAPPEAPDGVDFIDVAAASGIDFVHQNGGQGEKAFIETMGGGVVLFDLEQDGDLDAYLVQSGALPGTPEAAETRSRLYANDGHGRFREVAGAGGADNRGSYGMGASAADYDNDGQVDLYLTNFGANRLYHNQGDGTFRDVTAEAGVGDPLWSVSAAWGDFNGDGLLDLYVANYLNFTMANNKWCGRKVEGVRAYCHPDQYDGEPPRLYLNQGDGTFADRTVMAGMRSTEGKGMGAVAIDLDGDGRLDLFAANDSTINYVWRNRGDGTFEDLSLTSGAGYNEDGAVQACMGVDAADFDRDGDLDLFMTNLDLEYNTLYLNKGAMAFEDISYRAGVADAHLREVGFGTNFLDYDLDGLSDLLVVNGHIIDNIELTNATLSYAQPKTLLANLGNGRFEPRSDRSPDLMRPSVSRGSAIGDVDGDGDIDVLVGSSNRPAELLRNVHRPRGGFLVVRTVSGRSNRQGIGARLTLETGTVRQVTEVRAGTSYASSSDPRVTFGLGDARGADALAVRWPSGREDRYANLPRDAWVTIVEGEPSVRIDRPGHD